MDRQTVENWENLEKVRENHGYLRGWLLHFCLCKYWWRSVCIIEGESFSGFPFAATYLVEMRWTHRTAWKTVHFEGLLQLKQLPFGPSKKPSEKVSPKKSEENSESFTALRDMSLRALLLLKFVHFGNKFADKAADPSESSPANV